MCESSVFVKKRGQEKLLLADVVLVRPTKGGVYIEDILGRSEEIAGHIELIDLVDHRVVVSED
jgi:predicted RNA-binding protein